MIISPLLLKLWLGIFFGTFNGPFTNSNSSNTILYSSFQNSILQISYETIKLSICCAISQLLLYVGAASRIPVYRTIITSFIFILIWNFSFSICIYVSATKFSDQRILDDYAISFVYLFAGAASLAILFDIPSRHVFREAKILVIKIYPQILSFIGLFFLWLSFALTHCLIGTKETGSTITDRYRLVFMP